MSIPLLISILSGAVAITVSIIGAWFANRNSIILQTRKLKEEHYVAFLEALHNLASDNQSTKYGKEYTYARDKLLLIASEDVIKMMILFEAEVRDQNNLHDECLTELIKSIRKDLRLRDKSFPIVGLRK
ncbi:hypothetical protein [Fluviicola taffensis]|uniref:hypothetical protein n=1 Tax=Fluviicola taffensis TaxID=191579 RepID=UPI00313814BB